MQFQTLVPTSFEKKIQEYLSSDISQKVIELYKKVNNADFVAGKVITDGLINLFDLDNKTQKIAVEALEVFTQKNIFLGSYFLKRLDVLSKFNLLEDIIPFLTDLMKYSGRKASYSLYRIDDALVTTSRDYMRSLIRRSHKLMPQLEWSSGVIIEKALPLFESFGETKPLQIIELAADIFPNRPTILQFYFDWATKLFSLLTMEEAKKILTKMSKEQSNEILRDQMHALSQLSKSEILSISKKIPIKIGLSEKELKTIRYKTLENDLYFNVFIYPEISNDLYFSAIFRRWYTFTLPIRENILSALSKKSFKQFFYNSLVVKKRVSEITKKYSSSWDNSNWIFAGKRMSEKRVVEIIDTLFATEGKHFEKKPTLIKTELSKEYKSIKKGVLSNSSLKKIVKTVKSYVKKEEILGVLNACQEYLEGNYHEFAKQYSNSTLVAKIWERNPWIDMARSDELFSCTFMGDYGDYGSPLYLYDNSITFMDFFLTGKRKGRAYLLIATDEQNNDILFVDIFEGSNVLMRGKNRFDLLIRALVEYAKDLQIKSVVFNGLIYYNDTPRKFIELLKEKDYSKSYYQIVRKKYDYSVMEKLAPNPKPPFLNAFKTNMTTLADGVIIDVDDFLRRSLSGL